MSDVLKKYDSWLDDDGPAALVIREHLIPVEGEDGVLFPATFAAGDNFPGGYNVNSFGEEKEGKNVCLIDSVGSQANRTEPLFAREKYAGLVPQVVVKAGEKSVNLLEAGHRAGDAIVRCTALQAALQSAFKAVQQGNTEPLAKIAPTSLVFGVWDSRDTQAKMPRLIASTIRAFNVQRLTRSAQFNPATEFVNNGLLEEPADKAAKEAYAQRGFIHVPASASHGGVIATGGIRRDATLSLAALRLLNAGSDGQKTLALRRYILGLALVAFTYRPSSYLRQGCNLVLDPNKSAEFVEVTNDGKRTPSKITHDDALAYAKVTAQAFGIGKDQQVEFDKELAKKDVQGDNGNGERPAKGGKKKQPAS
ncbi:MAG TPA: type I-U CRISPR-associated RAMP protein Csb1/Cas7u [Phycisphaerae bacterium]|nr:type I-U CRISPR-associated RAMP protein Csb1/Cas7u [Phycisphaerae bacterium]